MAVEKLKLTAEKVNTLNEELTKLEGEERVALADRLDRVRGTTRDEFDTTLSELLEEKAALETRILEIKDILFSYELIDESAGAKSVTVGVNVTLESAGKTFEYKIVEGVEADPLNGKISEDSLVGKALLNKKVGDKATTTVNGIEKVYTIKKISY